MCGGCPCSHTSSPAAGATQPFPHPFLPRVPLQGENLQRLLQQPGLCGQLGKLCCVPSRLSSWCQGVMAVFRVPLIKQVPGPPGCAPAFHLETSEEKMGGTRANATLSFLGCQQPGAKLTRFLVCAYVLPRNRYILPLRSWRISRSDIHATLFPELLPWGGKGAGSRRSEPTGGDKKDAPTPYQPPGSPTQPGPAPTSPLGAQSPDGSALGGRAGYRGGGSGRGGGCCGAGRAAGKEEPARRLSLAAGWGGSEECRRRGSRPAAEPRRAEPRSPR